MIKEVVRHVLSYWYLLLIFIGLALLFAFIKKKPTTYSYVAELTFTINQLSIQSGEESNFASLITDFGIGNTGSSKDNSANRLIELSKSDAVLSKVLFRVYPIGGDTNYLANHFINIYDENINDSTFFEHYVSPDSLTRGESAVLKSIINRIRSQNVMFTISPAQIFTMTTQSTNEEFSKVLAEAYYSALSELYTKGAVAKAQSTYEFAEQRLEEATNKLLSAERELANWQDRNLNLVKRSAYLTEIDLTRTVEIYNGVYAETLKSFEAAKINLENQRPVFQMIDPPRYPLQRVVLTKSNIFLYATLGALALFFMITISLYFYKKYGYLIKELLDS